MCSPCEGDRWNPSRCRPQPPLRALTTVGVGPQPSQWPRAGSSLHLAVTTNEISHISVRLLLRPPTTQTTAAPLAPTHSASAAPYRHAGHRKQISALLWPSSDPAISVSDLRKQLPRPLGLDGGVLPQP